LGGGEPIDTVTVTGAGSLRGVVLHKLMEELLSRELAETMEAVQKRATVLVQHLVTGDRAAPGVDPHELAETALRTVSLPELAANRDNLAPEIPVYGCMAGDCNQLVTGRADAVLYRQGRARIVFDWKSDIAPDPVLRGAYAHQLALYVEMLGAERGAVVYMTSGQIEWVKSTRRA
jgi:CRISPR-associated exonuclease Cas4